MSYYFPNFKLKFFNFGEEFNHFPKDRSLNHFWKLQELISSIERHSY
jgi:hypothetical protein